jgi:translation elongation factor EF-Tu-like GTPase
MSSQQKVNVGTIGHIDHGKTTLVEALAKLGAILVDDVTAEKLVRGSDFAQQLRELDDIDVRPHGLSIGRPRNKARKSARKARLLDLQRRAFTGEASK